MSRDAVTLRFALVPQTGFLADFALVCVGAGLIVGAAQVSIPLPFTPVPVTGQTFAVLLVGAGLGSVRGLASTLLYLLLGVAGLGVYAGGAHGWSQISGATGGYLVGFLAASALVGWLAEQRWDWRFSSALGAMLTGNLVIYLIALPWLAITLHTDLEKTLEYGLYPFVAGDMIKLYLAAALLPATWRLVRRNTAE